MIVNKVEDNHITGIKFNDNIIADKSVVGTFVKNTAELKVINLNHIYDNLKGEYIDIEGFGSWYVNDLETDEEFTESTLQLNDITQRFDETYDDTFPFPDTMKNWAIWIGEKVGVPLKGDFLKSDLILIEKPYFGDNPKYRDAVKFIAKITGNYAQKNYDNTYSIKWFEDKAIDIENWESFVHGNATKPINVIVLSTGDTEENVKWPEIEPKEPHELRIEDDWTNIDRYELNEAIYNQVNGFFYVPISKLEIPFGLLELRAGQKIKTKDIELKDIETYISSITLEWQGGDFNNSNAWTSSIKMEELNETSTNLKYANSVLNRVIAVERKADKNAGLIEDTIKETKGNSEKITSLNMSVGGIGLRVEKLEDDKAVTGASIIMKINEEESEIAINADKLKLEGYTTINEGFGVDLDGNAFMNGATINGGNIEMLDDGKEDEHSIRLYKKSNIEEKTRILQVGEDIGGKTLTLTFPDGFEGTYLGSSIAYDNIIECENGFIRYQHGYMTSESYQIWLEYNPSPNVEITYIDMFIDYYEDGVHNIQTNEKTIIVPEGFGKIKSMNANLKNEDSNKPLYEYILYSYKEVKYATEFNSNGVLIKKDNIQASYQGNGMEISDTKGKRSFNTNGINWMTPYGYDFAEFTVNNEALIYSSGSQFLIDFMGSDASNHNLELIIDNETALRVTKNGIQTPNVETWQSDKRLKENIHDSDYKALDIVKRIRHRKFKFKDKEEIVAIGYVADELEELDENLIFEVGDKKIKHPKQSYIIPILSKAIQEQQIQIEELKQEINKLKEASK